MRATSHAGRADLARRRQVGRGRSASDAAVEETPSARAVGSHGAHADRCEACDDERPGCLVREGASGRPFRT
ncbi:hypothetical protein JCM11754A_12400 [Isoptericola variabilis]